jgi:D-alanyl-D-alanine carboxypeptidase/D-alanyl-D-alanine-endopeptidase (penicillin-binding protein 4)
MPEKSPIPVYTKRKEAYQPGAQIIFPSMQDKYENAAQFLSDTLGRTVTISNSNRKFNENVQTFYSASRDSVCKKMMFESDNFIAEQLLLMIGNTLTGSMNENKLMGKILSDSIYAFPQKPIWVDGSGLSRYNLFSPEDLVYLLRKIEKDFGKKKVDAIFPTGNEGPLKGTYDDKAGYLYAKTGTLSGQITLSGYLTTKKNTPLIFSVI